MRRPTTRPATNTIGRRDALRWVAAAAVISGCASNDADTPAPDPIATSSPTTPLPNGQSPAPVWKEIPDQAWMVGQTVELDLAQYCTHPSGLPLTFSLDKPLPPGLRLEGSVIRGTCTAVFAGVEVTATATDHV